MPPGPPKRNILCMLSVLCNHEQACSFHTSISSNNFEPPTFSPSSTSVIVLKIIHKNTAHAQDICLAKLDTKCFQCFTKLLLFWKEILNSKIILVNILTLKCVVMHE